MKVKYLLAHKFKIIGWILFVPAVFLGIYQLASGEEPEWLTFKVPALFNTDFVIGDGLEKHRSFVKIIENNWADEILSIMILLSALLLVFSEEREEDEYVMKLRLEALLWAALVNAVVLLFCILFIYDFLFFNVMILNLFLLFFLFIARFHWVLFKQKRITS